MPDNETKAVEFDRAKFKRLKARYGLAVQDNEETFMFEGHELLKDYAKYLIQYLDTLFKAKIR
jgi:hypothetical protein